jgi:peptidoglycan-associated lipoprotein
MTRLARTARLVGGAALAFTLFGCPGKESLPPPKPPEPTPVAKPVEAPPPKPPPKDPAVNLSDDIRHLCNIEENEKAPKFDFDSNDLSTAEKEVLTQVAKCLTTGALKGRSVQLVGRADPRGEVEYNFSLGHKRAVAVKGFLAGQGVDGGKMSETSRGELDATGTDEEGWRRDRRVDIKLLP